MIFGGGGIASRVIFSVMVVLERSVLQLENTFRSVLIFDGLFCQVFMPDVGKLASDKNTTVFFFDFPLIPD